MTYFGDEDYVSDWANTGEYRKLFPLYSNKLAFALRLLYGVRLQKFYKSIRFDNQEIEWGKHWASFLLSEVQYRFLEKLLDSLLLLCLRKLSLVVYFYMHLYNIFEGFLMIKEGFEEIWEDYYVFNIKDERELAHLGLVYFLTMSYVPENIKVELRHLNSFGC